MDESVRIPGWDREFSTLRRSNINQAYLGVILLLPSVLAEEAAVGAARPWLPPRKAAEQITPEEWSAMRQLAAVFPATFVNTRFTPDGGGLHHNCDHLSYASYSVPKEELKDGPLRTVSRACFFMARECGEGPLACSVSSTDQKDRSPIALRLRDRGRARRPRPHDPARAAAASLR